MIDEVCVEIGECVVCKIELVNVRLGVAVVESDFVVV